MNKKLISAVVTLIIASLACGSESPLPTDGGAPASSVGESRNNPHPAGTTVNVGSDTTITIVHVQRPANQAVADGNMFNATPSAGQEYLVAELQVACTKNTEEKCAFFPSSVKAVGADGTVHELEFVAGVPNQIDLSVEFFGGSQIQGNVIFLVPAGDQSVVLFYEPLFGDPIYMALPAQ